MSDFLSRLAARALGEAPALLPVVHSRWEGADEGASPGFVEAAVERVSPPLVPVRRGESARPEARGEVDAGDPAPRRRASPPAAEAEPPHPRPLRPDAPLRPRSAPLETGPIASPASGEVETPAAHRPEPGPVREHAADPSLEIQEVRITAPSSAPAAPRTASLASAASPPSVALPEEWLLPPLRAASAFSAAPPADAQERVTMEAERTAPRGEAAEGEAPARRVPRPAARSVGRDEEEAERAQSRRAAADERNGGRTPASAAPAASAVHAEEADAEEEPRQVIRVTIGRIEVRAAPAPAPAQPAARGWTPPVMSLDEYLEREARR